MWFGGTAHRGGEGMVAGVGAADCIAITTGKQRDGHWYPGSSLLSIQAGTPDYLTMLTTFRMDLPFSCLNLSGNILTDIPEL